MSDSGQGSQVQDSGANKQQNEAQPAQAEKRKLLHRLRDRRTFSGPGSEKRG
jgi:hypothetical protein